MYCMEKLWGRSFFYSHFLQSLNKFNVFGERQKMVSSINSKSVYLELQFEENSIRLETLIEKILCPGLYFWTVLQNGTMISIYSVCKYWQGTPSCIYRSIAIIGSCIAQPWVDCLVNLHHAVQKRKKKPIVCIDSWQLEASFNAFALNRSRLYVKNQLSVEKRAWNSLFATLHTLPKQVNFLPFIIRISGADSWGYICVLYKNQFINRSR